MSTTRKTTMHPDDVEFIRKLLRHGSIKWSGRAECLRLASKKVFVRRSKAGKPIYKLHWQCAGCEQWYRDQKSLEVDHIVEIGSFKGDWNDFMERHFPRPVSKFLQAMCVACHLKKTKRFNSARTRWVRKK